MGTLGWPEHLPLHLQVLDDDVKGFNPSEHRSTGCAPKDVTHGNVDLILGRSSGDPIGKPPQFKIGDTVGVSAWKLTFEIIRHRKVRGRTQYLVYWVWYSSSFDSWEYAEDIEWVFIWPCHATRPEASFRITRYASWPTRLQEKLS